MGVLDGFRQIEYHLAVSALPDSGWRGGASCVDLAADEAEQSVELEGCPAMTTLGGGHVC